MTRDVCAFRNPLLALSLAWALALLGSGAPPTALAQPGGDVVSNDPPEATHAEMKLDCTNMSDEARTYADEHKLCENAEITPYGVVEGSCGSSYIFFGENQGSGRVEIDWGFTSTLGTVVYRNLTVSWSNWNQGTNGSFPDPHWMFSDTLRNSEVVATGSGQILAGLSGTVTLVWGGQCNILYPTATEYVS